MIPYDLGDEIGSFEVREIVRSLFASGYFNDVRIGRDGNVLVISLEEHPQVESIEVDGNKAIPTDNLIDSLKDQGLAQGELLRRAALDRVTQAIEQQYVGEGRYDAEVEATIDQLPRNRVAIKIQIREGKPSSVRQINLVGVTAYPEEELLDLFEIKHPSLFSFIRNDHKYSRQKFAGDIEKLEAHFKNRGYVNYRLRSTQLSLSPTTKDVYLTLAVEEGEVHRIGEVSVLGDIGDLRIEDLQKLPVTTKGEIFSQQAIVASESRLTRVLTDAGFSFATASGVPLVREDGLVDVEFFVDAGRRATVRRIEFSGNTITNDEVLRREVRQFEGAVASTRLIDLSKVRLERLGYFRDVSVETPQVPGTETQIDVAFEVEEQPSGSISATVGYSQGSGVIFGTSLQNNNVLGTGNSFGISASFSRFISALSVNYFDPYFTLDGISRGYNIFLRRTDFEENNIARFTTDSFGGGVNFGFPISEVERINFGARIITNDITAGSFPALEIEEFLDANDERSTDLLLQLGWQKIALNRGLFPDRGHSQRVSLEASVPGSDLQYFKVAYEGERYFPLVGPLTLRVHTEVGYGDGYGGTESLPFYENFFAGGFGSVRGFRTNTLGPRSTISPTDPFTREGDPFGGNVLVLGGAEVVFPMPFVNDPRQFRTTFFLDAGNVFSSDCSAQSNQCLDVDLNQMRWSVGLSATWLTGLGPMTFSFAKPFNTNARDEREHFQFELGRTF